MRYLLIVIFTMFNTLALANEVSLQPDLDIQNMDVAFEHGAKISLDRVMGFDEIRWQPTGNKLNAGIQPSAIWLRFDIEHIEVQPSERYLVVDNAQIKSLDIYMVANDELVASWQLGNEHKFSRRAVATRKFSVPVLLQGQQSYRFYVRILSDLGAQATISLQQEQAFWAENTTDNMVLGGYLGILLIFIILNGAAFLLSNHYLHLLLALDLFAFGALHASHLGIGFQYFWPYDPGFQRISVLLFAFLTLFFACLFSWHFLYTAQTKVGRYICNGLLFFSLAGVPALWLLPWEWLAWYCGLLVVVESVFLVGLIIIALLRRSDPEAPYLAFSYTIACIAFIIYALQELGLLAMNHLTEYAIAYGVLLQGVILTLVLVYRRTRRPQIESGYSPVQLPDQVRGWVAQFSHEIRTPLNGILGMADLLKETPLNPTQYGYVRALTSSGDHLATMLNDVLDFESLSAGKVVLQPSQFSPQWLVEECCELFTQQARENNVMLDFEISDDVPPFLSGDSKRIRQVLTNIISNGIKFSQGGKVSVSCHYDADNNLCLVVEDDGIGMTQQQQEKIFGYFEQGDASVYQRYGGSGLGLAICKQLVLLMGGDIKVESQEGQYCRFLIELPLRRITITTESSEMSAHEDEPLAGLQFGQSLYVLAVDDNEVNRKVVSAMLAKLGHQVEIACSGQEAVALIEDGRSFDLILMDCEMPGMDGYEASRRIRQWQYAHSAQVFTIIALTAHALEEYKEASLGAGMDGHLSKPIRLQELKQLTEQLYELKTPS